MAFPDILIGSKFDAKGFKQAERAVDKLAKNVKSTAAAFGLALSARAVVNFSKVAVKAFAEDEAGAAKLAKTVDNLGLSFANTDLANFVEQLSAASGVVDDELRPALQALLTTTGSLAGSQKLLTQAIDISRGSGVGLAEVSQDLANAYVGNIKGLKKYNLGLTQAELKAATFTEIQKRLNEQFSGSSSAYLNTYAGKMQLLSTAAGEATETIGKGLIDAFNILAGNNSIGNLSDKMADLASNIADFFRGLAFGFKNLANMPIIKQLLQLTGLMLKLVGTAAGTILGAVATKGARTRSAALAPSSSNAHLASLSAASNTNKMNKAEKDAAARAKALLDAQKKNTAELKKQSALKKAQGIFDMDKIQAIAALQGKITEEEKLRLQLQLALLMGNEDYAKKLSEKLAESQLRSGNLAVALKDLPTDINPFKDWVTDLDKTLAKLREIAAFNMPGGSSQRENLPSLSPTVASLVTGASTGIAGSTSAGDVYITVNGSVLSEQDLVDAVQNGLNYNALAGKKSDIGRIAGMFG